ncbi:MULTISPECIES: sigma 54-interacting transcriptional regulator [Clostridium]|jgi:Transcriptional antiterminator|uniref:Sigma 54-interacting transcriptional regulator n=3 Tax=Clostridium beijerinckii TaxID=1520 RepID=A0A1S8PF99_CLOBE|nr:MULTISPECIES: sigma 54-interacting transcriptional regulator [Clostridium]ABR36648.1 sigma-54 factor, interaction domain-containing protein [Clostridium beijerinckii NCIMB 8052]AIU03835.1 sigma-54 factor interaction domain-containing protein [Clostridium beijerinckii ATCC 35702]MBF7808707.1 sigma 54-interacting transcriptional regulator [Clostridium beijerinckii]MCI1476909.1 sigma 54-interacting transcriptional regulator [Clostridium beijerinckii]MCI1578313.1 sigma 54-interacting transcript
MKGLPRKEEVIKSLIELEKIKGRGITADELGFYIGIDRTNISRYLNQLYKEKRINKKEGRPVIYSSIKSYKNEMNSIKNKSDIIVKNIDSLEMLIGSNQSLKLPVQQAKAAILYPPRGLHALILGETGVGKSLFAEAMYNFAKDSKIIAAEAPFIRFNCADYSDNPQLVVAQIFGVKKGAFTGADTDREGLLKKADGGIFFLDEVHRLSPQGQEMLFTFIDKGYFRQLGDTEKKVKSEVQIIAATTENPQSYLLKTFTRRIPMVIVLPTLRERKLEERYLLLNEFITEESIRIGKSIYISKNAIISFLLYDCPNNIGQLKSDIQLACAKAFLNYKIKKNNYILVDKSDLQPRIQKGIMRIRECRKEIDNLSQDMADILRFSSEDSILKNIEFHENQIEGSENKSFYSIIENKMENLKARGINETEINDILNIDLEKYFRRYISNITTNVKKDEIAKIVNIKVATVAEKMLSIASEKLNRDFDQKVYFGLALHLQGSIERINSGKKIYHPKLNIIRVENREEFAVAMDIIKIAEKEFHIDIPLDEIGYITMFLAACNDENSEQLEKKARVLVMMHGTSTASSMAEVANSLIGEEYVQALDMPLTMKAEDMLEKAKKKIKEIYNEKGILLLVDMGSLVNFGDIISNELEIKIKTIDMVTTLTVIEAGSKAFNGRSLDSIYNLCRDIGKSSMQVSKEDYKYNKELVIITTCFTGEGAAERIKIRISNNLKNIEKVKIIPLNISDREEFFRKVNRLKEKFVVLAVVGTINIVIENVQFIPAQDVFLNEGINYLENLVDIEYDFLKVRKALSIELNELNSIKVFSDIRDVIRKIEENLKVRIQHDAQIGILIHITFLIDKLKHGGQELKFKDLENYRHMYNSEFSLIKKILKDLERVYNINIGDNEIAYIVRIVKENIVTV